MAKKAKRKAGRPRGAKNKTPGAGGPKLAKAFPEAAPCGCLVKRLQGRPIQSLILEDGMRRICNCGIVWEPIAGWVRLGDV